MNCSSVHDLCIGRNVIMLSKVTAWSFGHPIYRELE